MKSIRPLLLGTAALALALLAGGCWVTSGQIFVNYALPSPVVFDSSVAPVESIDVDLNTIGDYEKHKDKLKGLADLALLGRFRNQAATAVTVEIWITPGTTSFGSVRDVRDNAVKLWGPLTIPADGQLTVDWKRSVTLFTAAGKQVLITETKGDGKFTLYALSTSAGYNVAIQNGQVVLVLDAGV